MYVTTSVACLLAAGWFLLFGFFYPLQNEATLSFIILATGILFVIFSRFSKERTPPWLHLYPIISLFFSLLLSQELLTNQAYLFPLWLLLTAFCFDAVLYFQKKKDPLDLVETNLLSCKESASFWHHMDTLTGHIAEAMEHNRFEEVQKGLNIFSSLFETFHPKQDKELFYQTPLEMLSMLEGLAMKYGLSVYAERMTSTLGKISLDLLKQDPKSASLAVEKVGNSALCALQEGEKNLTLRRSLLLQQLAKQSRGQPGFGTYFTTCTQQLNQLAKLTYQLDKYTPLSTLLTPFLQLKEALNEEPFISSSEYPEAMYALNEVIDEFAALQAVLQKIPQGSPGTTLVDRE